MRKSELTILSALSIFVLAAGACSNVNVEAQDETVPPHEQTFREEMEGRSPDYRGPTVIELPEPDYPTGLAGRGLEGIMMIRVFIGYQGQVYEAEVQQGLHPELDAAALEEGMTHIRTSISAMKALLIDPETNRAEEAGFPRTEETDRCAYCNFRRACWPDWSSADSPP